MKIAFLTTHLTGTGHLVRTLALAREAVRQGDQALILNGGRPLDHIDMTGVHLLQLPPLTVRSLDYGTLRTGQGDVACTAYMATRISQIVAGLHSFQPDILMTETFPLGRRALRAEYMAALAATPAIAVASVRDIPEPKPKRVDEATARLNAQYAALLVHGDEAFIPLSTSWPMPDLGIPVFHTGYVAEKSDDPPIPSGVLVSVGGGALGRSLIEAAAAAARLSDLPWHLLTIERDNLPSAPNLRVEAPRLDYSRLLDGAKVSISLCGYNTAMDLAQCETPALLVPMVAGGEREQHIRATHLSRYPGIKLLEDPNPAKLASAAAMLARTRRPRLPLDLNGTSRSITTLHALMRPA